MGKAKLRAEKLKRIKASAAKSRVLAAAKSFTFNAGVRCKIQAEQEAEGDQPAKKGTFSGVGYTGGAMKPDGWETPIVVDLTGIVQRQDQPALRQHDHEQIVGHTTKVEITDQGIEYEGVFSGEPHHVAKVAHLGKNGFPWQLSIGADPVQSALEYIDAGEVGEANGREFAGPVYISRKTNLREISFVPLGADDLTHATIAASSRKVNKVDPKIALKFAMSLQGSKARFADEDIDKMSPEEAKAALKKCMKAADDDDKDDDNGDKKADEDEKTAKAKASRAMDVFKADMAKMRAEMRAEFARDMAKESAQELKRQSAIRAAASKYGVSEIEVDGKRVNATSHAIENMWSEDKATLEILKASRPGAGVGVPGGHFYSTSQPELSDAVIEAAILQAGNCELFSDEFFTETKNDRGRVPTRETQRIKAELSGRYTDKVMQAAHSIFKGRIGLQQVFTTIAAANGHRVPQVIRDDSDLGAIIAATKGVSSMGIMADGSSTASLANVTANVLNKFLLQGYLYTEQSYKEISASRAVKDFKATKSINLLADTMFKEVGPSGELDHAMLTDQPFANQAKTYGRMITITRTNIINDDLGALTQVPALMGRGWGLKMNELFWTKFLNPGFDDGGSTNFFAATHTLTSLPGNQTGNTNVSTGTGSTLTSAGLQAAELVFNNQIDPMGKPLGVNAELLLFPSDLKTAATELMTAPWIVAGGLAATNALSKQPSTNIWQGAYKPVMSRYLNKSTLGGNYSTAAWYLLANPNIIPVIEIAYLNGQEAPTVQTAGQDFEFNILGMAIRAFFDAGVNMQNFRGGVRSAGS